METQIYNSIQQAVNEGVKSTKWFFIIFSLIFSGLGVFIGAFLKRRAENLAIDMHFERVLEQLKKTTKITEDIKADSAMLTEYNKTVGQQLATKDNFNDLLEQLKKTTKITEDIKADSAMLTEYNKTVGQQLATKDNFNDLLEQLKTQTKEVEKIRGIIATEIARREKIDDALLQYSKLQCSEFLEVYRMLYEAGEITETVNVDDFVKIIKEADQRILKPLTDFSAFVDEEDMKKLIYPVHNILDQFKYNPSRDAIKAFIDFRQSFYGLIASAINQIQSVYVDRGKSQ
jgi:hypothetical protein